MEFRLSPQFVFRLHFRNTEHHTLVTAFCEVVLNLKWMELTKFVSSIKVCQSLA